MRGSAQALSFSPELLTTRSQDHVTFRRIEKKTTTPAIRNRITYAGQRRHEYPVFRPEPFEEAEAPTSGQPRQRGGIRWARSRGS